MTPFLQNMGCASSTGLSSCMEVIKQTFLCWLYFRRWDESFSCGGEQFYGFLTLSFLVLYARVSCLDLESWSNCKISCHMESSLLKKMATRIRGSVVAKTYPTPYDMYRWKWIYTRIHSGKDCFSGYFYIQWNPDFSNPWFPEPPDISNQTLFPLALLHSSSIISPPISRTLDFSKLTITGTNFGSRGTNWPSIPRTCGNFQNTYYVCQLNSHF